MVDIKSGDKSYKCPEIYKKIQNGNGKNYKRKKICFPGGNLNKTQDYGERSKNRKRIDFPKFEKKNAAAVDYYNRKNKNLTQNWINHNFILP